MAIIVNVKTGEVVNHQITDIPPARKEYKTLTALQFAEALDRIGKLGAFLAVKATLPETVQYKIDRFTEIEYENELTQSMIPMFKAGMDMTDEEIEGLFPVSYSKTMQIIFSKNRACQLDALLRSMRGFITNFDPSKVVVLYKHDEPFAPGYAKLRQDWPLVRWQPEKDFRTDLRRLLPADGLLQFLTDDSLFIRPFTFPDSLPAEVFTLAPRLSPAVLQPSDSALTSPYLVRAGAGAWELPFSISNIYRVSDVSALIRRSPYRDPESLETAINLRLSSRDLFCAYPAEAAVVDLHLNSVRAGGAPADGLQPDALERWYLDGGRIDIAQYAGRDFLTECCYEQPQGAPGAKPKTKALRIAVVTIATAGYTAVATEMLASLRGRFCPDSDLSCYLYTDTTVQTDSATVRKIASAPHAEICVRKFDCLLDVMREKFDRVFWIDADMILRGYVPETDLDGELVVWRHFGFWNKERQTFPYDRRPEAAAYVPDDLGEVYIGTCFFGGKPEAVAELCRTCLDMAAKDLATCGLPRWSDEAYVNHYCLKRNVKILDTAFVREQHDRRRPVKFVHGRKDEPDIGKSAKNWPAVAEHDFVECEPEEGPVCSWLEHNVVITLARKPELLAAFLADKPKSLKFTVFHGFDFAGCKTKMAPPSAQSMGTFGCGTSHLAVLKLAKALDWPQVCIWEDDARLMPDFLRKVAELQACSPDWEALTLGTVHIGRSEEVSPGFRKAEFGWGTHCYLIKREAYAKVEALWQTYSTAVDCALFDADSGVKVLHAVPGLSWQAPHRSETSGVVLTKPLMA